MTYQPVGADENGRLPARVRSTIQADLALTTVSFLNVASRGAVGDGVTNDRTAIQGAIDAATALGIKTVYLPRGTYMLGSSLTPKSGVTLYGPEATIKRSTTGPGIYGSAVGFSGFTVDGITFEGSVNEFPTTPKRERTTTGGGLQTAVALDGDLNPNGSGQAVLRDFTMRNCTVKNVSGLPILLQGVRGVCRVEGSSFLYTMDAGFTFCEEVIFARNHVYGSADNGVSISRGCKKIVCASNVIENCAYNGIWVAGFLNDQGPTHFAVTGNVVRSVGHNGIIADYAASFGTITGNTLDGGFYRGPSDYPTDIQGAGVYIGGFPTTDRANPTARATGITVVGNLIRRFPRAGVYLNGVSGLMIANNAIEDIGSQYLADGTTAILSSDSTTNCGVLLENFTTSADVKIIGNLIRDTRGTPYMNNAVVPIGANTILASFNDAGGMRNASTLLETGPTRTWQGVQVYNGATRHVAGATVGANAASGTIPGFDTNGAAGSVRPMRWLTAGLARWSIRANATAEGGSDAGSDLEILPHTDAGTGKTVITLVKRSTGQWQFPYPVKEHSATTANRPTAPTAGVGAHMFDTTLNKPIWSDGTNWRDAAGTVV